MGLSIDLADSGTLLFTSDQCLQGENYQGEPMGAVLLDQRAQWRDSLQRIHDFVDRTDATVYTGHDLEQFEDMPDAWT